MNVKIKDTPEGLKFISKEQVTGKDVADIMTFCLYTTAREFLRRNKSAEEYFTAMTEFFSYTVADVMCQVFQNVQETDRVN